MRDKDRQKVYNAERRWRTPLYESGVLREDLTLEEAREIVAILAEQYSVSTPRVIRNPRMTAWGGWYRWNEISLPSGPIKEATVLHEFAHHLDRSPDGHGPSFCRFVEDVTFTWLGDATLSQALRSEFVAAGIDVDQTPEQRREEAAERRMKRREQIERAEDRHGETTIAYVVRDADSNRYVFSRDQYCFSLEDAKVFVRESTAVKYAEDWSGIYWSWQVRQVEARWQPIYGPRGGRKMGWVAQELTD